MSTDCTSDPQCLDRAELYGQCQFTTDELIALLELPTDQNIPADIMSRYRRGLLQAQVSVRRALLQKAQDGDSAALREFSKIALMFNPQE